MKSLKFLVIEDDDLLREALRGALRESLRELQREAIIFEASDPSEATRIVKQGPHIDLILLDLELPDTDGFEFLKELEAIYALRLESHSPGYSPFAPSLDLTLSWYPTVSLVVVSERQGYDIFEYVGENRPEPEWLVERMGEDYKSGGPTFNFRGVLFRAFAAGAIGFIPKSSSRETMLDAFRRIFAGGHYVPSPPPPPSTALA